MKITAVQILSLEETKQLQAAPVAHLNIVMTVRLVAQEVPAGLQTEAVLWMLFCVAVPRKMF